MENIFSHGDEDAGETYAPAESTAPPIGRPTWTRSRRLTLGCLKSWDVSFMITTDLRLLRSGRFAARERGESMSGAKKSKSSKQRGGRWREEVRAQFEQAYREALRKMPPLKEAVYARDLTVRTIFYTPDEIAAAKQNQATKPSSKNGAHAPKKRRPAAGESTPS